MMYCPKCGKPVNDNDRFCGACGANLSKDNATYNSTSQDCSTRYLFYEKFGSDNPTSSVNAATIVKSAFWTPALISTTFKLIKEKGFRGGDAFIDSFIITDRSIIVNGQEYPFNLLNVFSTQSEVVVKTAISGNEIFLQVKKVDSPRFFNAIIQLNQKILLSSKRQELQYVYTLMFFLNYCHKVLVDLPITFDKENGYKEFDIYNEPIKINPNAIISSENQKIISYYGNAQKILGDFLSKNEVIPREFFPKTIADLKNLISITKESDSDIISIIQGQRERERQRQEEEARRLKEEQRRKELGIEEPSSPGILSSMIHYGMESSNIKRNRGRSGKQDLIGEAGCAKNNGGSCSSCNLRYACSRYF